MGVQRRRLRRILEATRDGGGRRRARAPRVHLPGAYLPLAAGEVMQRFGARSLWLLCLVVSVSVAVGHVLTAEPRRKRLLELLQPQQPAA